MCEMKTNGERATIIRSFFSSKQVLYILRINVLHFHLYRVKPLQDAEDCEEQHLKRAIFIPYKIDGASLPASARLRWGRCYFREEKIPSFKILRGSLDETLNWKKKTRPPAQR